MSETDKLYVPDYTRKDGKKVRSHTKRKSKSGPRRGADPDAAVTAAAAAVTMPGADSETAVVQSEPITNTGGIMEPTEADVRKLFDIIERADRGEFATDEEAAWMDENSNPRLVSMIREAIHRASFVRVPYDADTVVQNLMDDHYYSDEFRRHKTRRAAGIREYWD